MERSQKCARSNRDDFPGGNRTEYKWLLTTQDFANALKGDYGSAWVITPDIFQRAIKEDVRAIINDKLRSGVKYKYFLRASSGTDDDLRELKQMAESSLDHLAYNIFNREVFDSYAVTDYIIFNVDTDMDKALRMFLKLPIDDHECEYWIRVDEHSAKNFTTRFRNLWDQQTALGLQHQATGAT